MTEPEVKKKVKEMEKACQVANKETGLGIHCLETYFMVAVVGYGNFHCQPYRPKAYDD